MKKLHHSASLRFLLSLAMLAPMVVLGAADKSAGDDPAHSPITQPLSVPAIWCEGELPLESLRTIDPSTELKLSASKGRVLFGAALAEKGRRVVYQFEVPANYTSAKLIIRYARLHWRADMVPAEMVTEFKCGTLQTTGRARFGNTGGWGMTRNEWGLMEIPVGAVSKGVARFSLTSDSDQSDIVIDGFWLAPDNLAIVADELNSLDRISITDDGYFGLELTCDGIDQTHFSEIAVGGRSFGARTEKVTLRLLDKKGNSVLNFYEDHPFPLGNQPCKLSIAAHALEKLADGKYTLELSWGNGKQTLSHPLTLMGKLLAQCDSEIARLRTFLSSFEPGSNFREINTKADLQYALDYLENGLNLLRSHQGFQQEASANTKALAYFEKATQRSGAMFFGDLKALLDQSTETIRRLELKQDPYENRSGDFRRAFYSNATGKLEPYRIYIPTQYGSAQKVPVFMTLHGGGGDENQFPDLENGALLKIMEQQSSIMVSPKATSWYTSKEGLADLKQLLELVGQEYAKADKNRYYCTGVSRGGFGSYRLAAAYPGLLSGIACVSGAGLANANKNLDELSMDGFKRNPIPVLILHGESDAVVSPKVAEQAAHDLQEIGCPCELKIFPGYGHNYHVEEYMNLTIEFFGRHLNDPKAPNKTGTKAL